MTSASSPQPDPAFVREALRRITDSSFVPAGSVPATILTYVVERTLAGDDRSIKAYTIAVEALGRPPEFNPDRDSTVRVAAMRLRNALDLYYAGPGAADPLRIRMAPGSYRPSFEAQDPRSAAAAQGDTEPPAAAEPQRRRSFLSPAHWIIVLGAILAVDLAMTVSLMAVQMRGDTAPYEMQPKPAQKQVRAAEKPASSTIVLERIRQDVQRSYHQAVE
ncbi:hypothetical protein [Phreatobacter cathodiphilus]|uniref:Uncharacterized protein n=1 Tax=Phreatobacter cathodiphilus TaxID=1868589 RepID=A0A2S0N8L6_9HYPH|nr:hypothetical protein [Phreatobacter cathodiphilus]AVO44273.1 hypothetical protein C6569_03875 [Phreatobacter cathodiphilus]